MAMVDLGTRNWAKSSGTTGGFYSSSPFLYKLSPDTKMVCERYAYDGVRSQASYFGANGTLTAYWNNNTSTREIYIKDLSLADLTAAAFKTAMSGVKLCYELVTPTTVQLTPSQVSTLLGDNNIWADAGEVSVVYRADTGLYIDKKLAQALNA